MSYDDTPVWDDMERGYDDGPSVEQLAQWVATGRACCECQTTFRKSQPASTPNRDKTLCRVCTRLFVESRGYNMGPERDDSNEAFASRNRAKKNHQRKQANG